MNQKILYNITHKDAIAIIRCQARARAGPLPSATARKISELKTINTSHQWALTNWAQNSRRTNQKVSASAAAEKYTI